MPNIWVEGDISTDKTQGTQKEERGIFKRSKIKLSGTHKEIFESFKG